jgi:SAM-dependent methyltransferase
VLLDRIVRCASPEGGLVVDLFCGSGTTAEAAARAGRRAIASDKSPIAIATARSRLMRAGVAPTIERIEVDPPRARARVSVDGRRVTLREPKLPLAWAVDTTGGDVFRASWHAERTLGGPAAIPQFVDLERVPKKLRVRAWGDDGTLHEG